MVARGNDSQGSIPRYRQCWALEVDVTGCRRAAAGGGGGEGVQLTPRAGYVPGTVSDSPNLDLTGPLHNSEVSTSLIYRQGN